MPELTELARRVMAELQEQGLLLATAESCTGGMVATAITSLPGSSSVFDRGFVTYSYESKEELLNVSREILENHGAVSQQCASAMAAGALTRSRASIVLSITGIAGPGGGLPDKPVGLVYIGWGRRNGAIETAEHLFSGDRDSIRRQSSAAALNHILDCLGQSDE